MAIYLLYVMSPVIVWTIMNMNINNTKSIAFDDRRKKNYIVICGLIMALMIGLRYKGTGSGDTAFYYSNWEMMSSVAWKDLPDILQIVDMERGYQICVWFLSHIFPSGQWALFLSGAFFSISVCLFTYRNSKNPVLSLVVFNSLGLFNFMVQGLRQSIAMSICLLAYEQCKNRRFFKFALLVAIASLFHGSALVFILVYFLSKFRLSITQMAIFAVLTFIGLQFLPYAFSILNMAMNENYEMGVAAESGGVVAILIYAVSICFGTLFKDLSDEHYAMFVYSAIIASIAMLLRNSVNGIAERISFYFAFAQMIVLSNSIASMKDPNMKLIINTVAVLLCFGVALYKASYSVLIPYKFFWQA